MKSIKIISVITVFILLLAFVLLYRSATPDIDTHATLNIKKEEIVLGVAGSTHEHATLLLSVKDKVINFLDDKYMLQDTKVHFEDDNGVVIHKHADGVTLPYFFKTLGLSLTNDCIVLDTGRQYCSSEITGNTLHVIINGEQIEEVEYYEIKHEDKILVNYGNDTNLILKFKFNSVPSLPSEF